MIDGCATLFFFVEFVDAEMNGGIRLSSIDAYRAKQNIFSDREQQLAR